MTLQSFIEAMPKVELYLSVAGAFCLDAAGLEGLALGALRASLLPSAGRARLEAEFLAEFARLRAPHLPQS